MILDQDKSLILIIDIQEKLVNAVFNKDIVLKKSEILVNAASILDLPIFVTEQYPKGLGETVNGLKNNAKVYEKTDFNALTDPKLLSDLNQTCRRQVIVMGIETHICVHQTVTALITAGYTVTVVSDACGSRNQDEYQYALDCLKENGAKIKSTEMILFELLKSAKHPKFKEIQTLIK